MVRVRVSVQEMNVSLCNFSKFSPNVTKISLCICVFMHEEIVFICIHAFFSANMHSVCNC